MASYGCPMAKVLTSGGRVVAGRIIAGGEGGEVGGYRTKGSKNKAPRKDKGQKKPERKLSEYNLFVKKHMGEYKALPAKERMGAVAKLAREQGVVGKPKQPKEKVAKAKSGKKIKVALKAPLMYEI
jgi:hypothetical protein